MMTAPCADALLTWIASRGGSVTFRDVVQRAPTAFRGKSAADDAIAALIAHGKLEEASSRPRGFRVTAAATLQTVADEPAGRTVADADLETVATASADEAPTVAAIAPDEVPAQSVAAQSVASGHDDIAERRASVEILLARMGAENADRANWFRAPVVVGKKIVLRNISGKEIVVARPTRRRAA